MLRVGRYHLLCVRMVSTSHGSLVRVFLAKSSLVILEKGFSEAYPDRLVLYALMILVAKTCKAQ